MQSIDLVIGLHTAFHQTLFRGGALVAEQTSDKEDHDTTSGHAVSPNHDGGSQRRNMEVEDGCKRSIITAATSTPPAIRDASRRKHQDGEGTPRPSPEGHSGGEAVDVVLVSFETEKDPVAAAIVSEPKGVSCAELCNTADVILQVNGLRVRG